MASTSSSDDDTFSPKTVEIQLDQVEKSYEAPIGIKTPMESQNERQLRFRNKEFKVRPSLLTTYFEEGSGALIYNFFIAIFLLAALGAVFKDLYEYQNPVHHLWLIFWNFEQLPMTILVWSVMFLSTTVFIYGGMTVWTRIKCEKLTLSNQLVFLISFLLAVELCLFFHNCCENTRLAMKSHAFVRENFSKGKRKKESLASEHEQKASIDSPDWPSLEKFIYFMFCPSFIYRDEYPRSATRDWRIVLKYAMYCLVCIYITSLAFTLLVYPLFQQLNYEERVSWQLQISYIFPSVIAGAVCMLMLFYGLLHSWLNMFSEAMFFGDRLFYESWWSSQNMAEYYRNWNLVVHEWLYCYVYKDIALLIGNKQGLQIAQILVFFLSSVFHEYWFGVSLRMFYPIMFTLYFVLGGVFFFISKMIKEPYVWNIAMWFNLLIGTGMFVACYAPEWYARQRCPRVIESDLFDILIPRIWSCTK
uniref:O-acyltransferase n=1 Tax=Ditylenchus dipsaci TaxID=166011 RepID=A0A915DCW8_9BILA